MISETANQIIQETAGVAAPSIKHSHGEVITYRAHYPVGRPSDNVSSDVPEPIAADFKEALRCRWVDAYNATVEMCRRAIETSCQDLGAQPTLSIQAQIDHVHA